MLPCTDASIDFGQDKIHGLIHQVKNRTFVDLVRWYRLSNHCPVKMRALDFGCWKKALRISGKKEDCRVGGPAFIQEVQVGEGLIP